MAKEMMEDFKNLLVGTYGLNDEQVASLNKKGGVSDAETMSRLCGRITADRLAEIIGGDLDLLTAGDIYEAYAPKKPELIPAVVPTAIPVSASADPNAPIPEGSNPSPAQINTFAAQFGMDSSMLSNFLLASTFAGGGMDVDLSGMIPISAIAPSYNPKVRNMPYMIMAQYERALGAKDGIVVINDNGSVNAELTAKYVLNLQEGYEPEADGLYYDDAGTPYEIIKVGVDAQSVYDADPVNPKKALRQSGVGEGRVNWNGVSLEVRQVVYFATQTGELSSTDESKLSWLRTNIKPGVTRSALLKEFPQANTAYNEAFRQGTLPMLRVQLSRGPRKPEIMPRRRPGAVRSMEAGPVEGSGFRRREEEV